MPSTTSKYFAFAHLPPKLQAVSKPIGELAEKLETMLPDGAEKSAGMRKLLEAKDCFVRASLDMPEPAASTTPPHQQRVLDEKQDLDLRIESPVESQRERLRREYELILVHGAASVIANRPGQAREVADGIKVFLDGLEVGAEDQAQAGDSLACKGINCGCTDGQSHSNECIVEAAMIQGWAGDKEARDAFAAIKSKTFASRAATESVATQPAAAATPVDDAI